MIFQKRTIYQALDEHKKHVGDIDFVAGRWRFTSNPNYALNYDQLDEVMEKINNLSKEKVESETKEMVG